MLMEWVGLTMVIMMMSTEKWDLEIMLGEDISGPMAFGVMIRE